MCVPWRHFGARTARPLHAVLVESLHSTQALLTRLESGRVRVARAQQREVVRLLYVATRHQVKVLAAVRRTFDRSSARNGRGVRRSHGGGKPTHEAPPVLQAGDELVNPRTPPARSPFRRRRARQ